LNPVLRPTSFPMRVDVIPGRLKARVYLHDIDTRDGLISCWTLVSDGLSAHRQKELQFTVKRAPDESPQDFPLMILDFFKRVRDYAENGQLVDVGGVTEFGPDGFLGRNSIRGLAYLGPQPLKDIDSSSPFLTVIVLMDEELKVAKAFGLTRVTASLGEAYRYFPYPPWADRSRPSVVSIETMEQQTILSRILCARVRGVNARLERGEELVLSVPRDSHEELRAGLVTIAPAQPLALLTNVDPQANACMVWRPGETGLNAITPPDSDGSRRSGNFVAFVPEQSANDFQYLEDGFALMLTNSTWMAIRRALESETSISVPVSKAGLKFSIEWLRATYVSPTDGRVYVAESWRTYGTADPDEKGPVATERFVLLTSDSELADRISIEELGNFMAAVKAVVVNQFVSVPRQPGQDLAIECEIDPGNESTFHLAARPGMDPEALQKLSDHLQAQSPPAASGSVKFQALFRIWGGTGAEFG